MGRVKTIEKDADFPPALMAAGDALVVVDFYADWCGPCRAIAPQVSSLSDKYPDVHFFKVNVDVCVEVKTTMRISSMPTFVFMRAGQQLESFSGADPTRLEETIVRLSSGGGGGAAANSDSCVPGQWVLNKHIKGDQVECLNATEGSDPKTPLTDNEAIITSDCDEQLLLSVGFNMPVKVHSLRLVAPEDGTAPMTIKIFANLTSALDFDQAESLEGVQTVTFSPEHIAGDGKPVELRYVKFQNVQNLTFFIMDNQGGEDVTSLKYLEVIGTPRDKTDMSEFKRVAGKAGEADH